MIKLNLGCGETYLAGYLNVDNRLGPGVDLICDVFNKLPFEDNSVESILAAHILEHVSHSKSKIVLEEWYRVLKPGGNIRIRVPNLTYLGLKVALKNLFNLRKDEEIRIIYGGQDYEGNAHFSGFSKNQLISILKEVGFVDFRSPEHEHTNTNFLKSTGYGLELEIVAKKPMPPKVLAFTEDSWNITGFYSGFLSFVNRISTKTKLILVKCSGASDDFVNVVGEVITLPSTLSRNRNDSTLRYLIKLLKIFKKLFKVIINNEDGIDYFLSNYDTSFIIIMFLAKTLKKRFILIIYETIKNEHETRKAKIKEKLKLWFASFSDIIIVTNQINKDYLGQNWINDSKINIFHLPLSLPEKLPAFRKQEMLCTIGVLEPKKHIDEVIRVVNILREDEKY